MSRTTGSTNVTARHEDAEKAGLTLSVPQVAGGALASVTTAWAASLFGAVGTLLGAALGSVVSSIATVVFGHSLIKARRTLRKVPALAASADRTASTDRTAPADRTASAERTASRRPAWRPVVLLAGGVFLIAMAGIWVTEAAIGHPISGGTRKGTTISEVVHGHAGRHTDPARSTPGSTAGEPSSSTSGAGTEAATSPAAGSNQNQTGPGSNPNGPGAGAPTG